MKRERALRTCELRLPADQDHGSLSLVANMVAERVHIRGQHRFLSSSIDTLNFAEPQLTKTRNPSTFILLHPFRPTVTLRMSQNQSSSTAASSVSESDRSAVFQLLEDLARESVSALAEDSHGPVIDGLKEEAKLFVPRVEKEADFKAQGKLNVKMVSNDGSIMFIGEFGPALADS